MVFLHFRLLKFFLAGAKELFPYPVEVPIQKKRKDSAIFGCYSNVVYSSSYKFSHPPREQFESQAERRQAAEV